MNKKIITSSLLVTLLSGISYANVNEDAKRIQEQQSGGVRAVSDKKVSLSDSDIERSGVDDYRDAVIASYIERYMRTRNESGFSDKASFVYDNEKKERERLEKERKNRAILEAKKAAPLEFYTRGYCNFSNDVEIGEMVGFAEIECVLDGIGYSTMSINIYPVHSAKALVAKGVDIFPNGNPEDRLHVKQGVILNGTRTGLNIASIVNDRKLEKMSAAGMLSSNTIIAEQSLKYMDALEASRQKEGSQVVPGTGGSAPIVVQTKNTQAPVVSDYLTVAGIRLVSSLAGIVGESMINNLPYLYKIKKGQRVYFDGLITDKRPSPENGPIKFTNPNVVNKTMQDINVNSQGIVSYKKSEAKDDSDNLLIEEKSIGNSEADQQAKKIRQ